MRKLILQILLLITILTPLLFVRGEVLAQEAVPQDLKKMLEDIKGSVKNKSILAPVVQVEEGEEGMRAFIVKVAHVVRSVVATLAVILIAAAGLSMIASDGDDQVVKKQSKNITFIVFGLVVMFVADLFVSLIFQEKGISVLVSDPEKGALAIRMGLIYGLLNLAKAFLAGVAVLIILINCFQMITAMGDEGKLKTHRLAVLYTLIGLIIVLLASEVVDVFWKGPEGLAKLPSITGVLSNYFIGLLIIVAFIMLIYAGYLMILHFGKDEQIKKAKDIVTYVIIGFALLISAYTLVVVFIQPFVYQSLPAS